MIDADKVHQLHEEWMLAEAAYAQCLATMPDAQLLDEPTRSMAIELAGLRASADQARDRYFRKALS